MHLPSILRTACSTGFHHIHTCNVKYMNILRNLYKLFDNIHLRKAQNYTYYRKICTNLHLHFFLMKNLPPKQVFFVVVLVFSFNSILRFYGLVSNIAVMLSCFPKRRREKGKIGQASCDNHTNIKDVG